MSEIKRINPGARMSEAVIHNGVAYLAGQVGAPTKSVTEQTEAVLAEVDRILALCGTDKSRLLMCQIFITDLADFPGMNEVWEAWLPAGHAPPRATVKAQLAKPEWKVEMVVTAAV